MKLVTPHIEEHELILACQQGKAWAQKRIYEQHAPLMMSVCLRYAGDRETAKDLLQEGFIKVFSKCDSYNGSGSFGGWVRRVFVTTALEYLRKNDVMRHTDDINDVSYNLQDAGHSVIDKISADDLMNCIEKLPENQRTVFNLVAIEGYSHTEIAKIFQMPEATCRSLYLRARLSLQKMIEKLAVEYKY